MKKETCSKKEKNLSFSKQSQNKNQALKDLDSLANARFDLPGDHGFPLNSVYNKPQTPKEGGNLYNFFLYVNK